MVAAKPNEPSGNPYPSPVAMNGTVIPNNTDWVTLDPCLIRRESDSKVFLFTTGNTDEPNGTVWTADSLYGPWEKQSEPMVDKESGAPQVYNVNGTYYMYYQTHSFNYSSIGVTNSDAYVFNHDASIWVRTSTTMEPGSWTDHGRLNITWQQDYNILDASLLTIDNATAEGLSKYYLTFGSYQTGIFQVPMADPPIQVADNSLNLTVHLEQNATSIAESNDLTEASFQYYRDGYYYLFFSSGICCPSGNSWDEGIEKPYHVMVCRSENPRGDYVDKDGTSCLSDNGGTQILATHKGVFVPGGQGVLDDDEVGTILYYHYVEHR
ncbi:hypothetical protein SLS53_006643 [Cytospora paraplurivora]|uniref:Endo-1,5-alpha-L-arabinanase A n=1 Tax=Cytospora paraplurivora TaxID=2898453 RepID=A0AAN9YDU6_9PEZI